MADSDLLLGAVRHARRRLAEEGPPMEREPGDFARVSLPSADADALRDLLAGERAGAVIEIGLAYGSSALAIAEGLLSHAEGALSHMILDPFQEAFGDAGWRLLAAAGLSQLCLLVRERSQLALARLVADEVVVDAAFVDGSHIFHNVFVDLYFLRELVRPGGLVVLDDCQWPSVATAVDYFEKNLFWQRVRVPGSRRLRAYRLPSERAEPSFEDFRPFGRGDF